MNLFTAIFIFSSTLFVYIFQRLVKLQKPNSTSGFRKEWMEKNKKSVFFLAVFSGLLAGISLLFLSTKVLAVIIPSSVVAFFYVQPFKKFGLGLREIPFLKVVFVTLVWMGVCVLIPVLDAAVNTPPHFLIITTALGLLIFGSALVFDIRDIYLDDKKLKTIPQLLGKNGALILAAICFLCGDSLLIYFFPEQKLILSFQLLFGLILLALLIKPKSDFFYGFWIDGFLLIPGFLCVLQEFVLSFN